MKASTAKKWLADVPWLKNLVGTPEFRRSLTKENSNKKLLGWLTKRADYIACRPIETLSLYIRPNFIECEEWFVHPHFKRKSLGTMSSRLSIHLTYSFEGEIDVQVIQVWGKSPDGENKSAYQFMADMQKNELRKIIWHCLTIKVAESASKMSGELYEIYFFPPYYQVLDFYQLHRIKTGEHQDKKALLSYTHGNFCRFEALLLPCDRTDSPSVELMFDELEPTGEYWDIHLLEKYCFKQS